MSVSHGHSVAAWTGTCVILVGAVLIGLGLIFAAPVLWILGIIGAVGGVVAWVALDKVGYGEDRKGSRARS